MLIKELQLKTMLLTLIKFPTKDNDAYRILGYQSSSLEFLGGALVASFNHITKPFRKKDLRI
ncbi:hypothetical protein HMPREF1234_1332 [Streptococcus pyogenes GA41039]|nr:hypothetical protein HMPREF1234_1332 [Streptococcus pyogenes GA41039]ESA48084.1 hypothetical protein HMPREF1235_1122 [Streptococcus pyogenes GA41208]